MPNAARLAFDSLAQVLVHRAASHPDATAYIFLDDDVETKLTFGELYGRALSIAAKLRTMADRGDRAVLLYPPGLEYIAAFFGCLHAGVIAVPAYPPDPGRLNRTLPRLQAIVADAQASVVLTTTAIAQMAEFLLLQAPDLRSKRWLATDAGGDGGAPPAIEPGQAHLENVAFLQYTSGSTGSPRGVVLTHKVVLENLALIAGAFEITSDSVGVSWLPPYHDMGLIGGILAPLYRGRPTVLMSPLSFLHRPVRWLRAVSRYRATISGGPNFAYELCVRKILPEERASLDLTTWEVAFTGAEPVRPETIERFASAFAPHGFRREAVYPCYGLAEATLLASGGKRGTGAQLAHVSGRALERNQVLLCNEPKSSFTIRALVGCGAAMRAHEIAIVNADAREPCASGEVGEIWLRGPSIAEGYWQRDEETRATFQATLRDGRGPFLRTGDLGFMHAGQLYVTGRLKDLLIIRGRNHYPQDIERTVEESHPALRRGCCAAFTLESHGEELLVVAVEVDRRLADRRWSNPPGVAEEVPTTDAVCDAIRRAVNEQHDLHVQDVVLLFPGASPKTSSGKIQRRECKESYLAGSLDKVASSALRTPDLTATTIRPGSDVAAALLATPPSERRLAIQAFLQGQVARILKMDVTRVGPPRSMSSLGLDSLMAVELSHRIEKLIGVTLAPTTFLRDLTIADLAQFANDQFGVVRQDTPRSARHTGDFRLSHGQEALWFLHALAPESHAYHLARAVRVRSEVNPIAMRKAILGLAERHPVLRTTYPVVDGRPVHRVNAEPAVDFECIDAAAWPNEALQARLAHEATRPFDLARGPLLRIMLFRRDDREHVLALVTHHIAVDLWSLVLLMSELHGSYSAALVDQPPPGRAADLDYMDFVTWQEEFLQSPAGQVSIEYWRKQLGGELPTLDLPTDQPRPIVQTYSGACRRFPISPAVSEAIRTFARNENTTLYVVLLAAYSIVLARYTGQEELLIGSPAAGRSRPEFDRVVGYFVNPVVIRARVGHDETLRDVVAHLRETVLDAVEHQDVPLPLIVQMIRPQRDPGRSPLFQVVFALEKSHLERERDVSLVLLGVEGAQARLGPLAIQTYPLDEEAAQFDLSVTMVDAPTGLIATVHYNTDLFAGETIERFVGHYLAVLNALATDAGHTGWTVPLLSETERLAITTLSRGVPTDRRACLHTLFEQQARATPDRVAVVHDDASLTYRELDRQADILSGELRRAGVRPYDIVAVHIDRSAELIIAILGVLKAGAAYLPLDPNYPPERTLFTLRDAGAKVVVAAGPLDPAIGAQCSTVVRADLASRPGSMPDSPAPRVVDDPDRPAYVIYTSGSTGAPKGVVVTHQNVVRLFDATRRWFELGEADVWTLFHSTAFDFSVWEIWGALLHGGELVIVPYWVSRSPELFLDVVRDRRVSVLNQTASAFRQFIAAERGAQEPTCGNLRLVILGGEAVDPRALTPWFERYDDTKTTIVNMYGITETTVHVTYRPLRHTDARSPRSVIGRAIPDLELYVLDEHHAPAPIGVRGEIYVGGAGLSSGYLGRPDLTSQRFLPAQGSSPGARVYRSGDLARRLPGDDLEYLGRADHQIKVRGFRIELGEIEAHLAEHPRVREVVVVGKMDATNSTRVVAYVVMQAATAVEPAELRAYLKRRLPDHMVPAFIVPLAAMPLTASGKLDRASLPEPEIALDEPAGAAPRTALEEVLAGLWADVLGVPRVGIHDDFFAIGGHSLIAAQLITRLREALPIELRLQSLFENPTVAAFAAAIRADEAARARVDRAAELFLKLSRLSDADVERILATEGFPESGEFES